MMEVKTDDGASQLYDGAKTLNTGAGQLYDGTTSLYSGTKLCTMEPELFYGGANTLASSYNEFDAGVASAKNWCFPVKQLCKKHCRAVFPVYCRVDSLASG